MLSMNKKTDKAEVHILHALDRLHATPAVMRLAVDTSSRSDRVSLFLEHAGPSEWKQIESFGGWFETSDVLHLALELGLVVVDRRLPY
jgi:hypothetical protein